MTIATGGDGGGSIRIPAGFNGLVGMKGTAGRIPRGPQTEIHPMTVVFGPMARSVRDVARWYDVSAGYDMYDPYSLPKIDGWERDLGTFDLRGRKAVICPNLGSAIVRPEVEERVRAAGELLAKDAGLVLVFDLGTGTHDIAGSPVNVASKLAQDLGEYGMIQVSDEVARRAQTKRERPTKTFQISGVELRAYDV